MTKKIVEKIYQCDRYPCLMVYDPKNENEFIRFKDGVLRTKDKRIQDLVEKIPEVQLFGELSEESEE